jgi:hypothetical protein
MAERELNEAIDYYNECQNGLGLEFAKEYIPQFRLSFHSLMNGRSFQKIPDVAF